MIPTCRSSFSTLHAGRVAATTGHHRPLSLDARLSVPSMRVESLQLRTNTQRQDLEVDFQYPPCGSSRCNLSSGATPSHFQTTFSTLHAGRVAATMSSAAGDAGAPAPFSTLHAGRVAAT